MELKGKTAVVTGASRGIGSATSILLAKRGISRVVMHYNSYQQGAEEARDAVRQAGAEAELIRADLSTNEGIRTLSTELKRLSPRTDILVNNAGHLVARAKLPAMSEELYDQIMNLNVKSMWFVSQAVVPYMMERKSGVIINLSSIAARNGGGPGATMYAASKAAVSTITKGMAKELAPLGIRVNAVSPGTVDNYFHEKHSTPQMLASMLASAPAGRLGTNEDIAEAIVWLCSDASSYIHGQTIEINGGMYMP
jgi:3-oxoacyl-[acyl-carrier protein] reductase